MARPKISNAALSDLAMGANSAAQAVSLYREAAQLDDREPTSSGDQQQPGRYKRDRVDGAVAQARLACRFLVQFIRRHGGKADQNVAHEIEQAIGGTDDDDRD